MPEFDLKKQIADTADENWQMAKEVLKKLLGDVYEENREDAQNWIALTAELQWHIALGKTPKTTNITAKHIDFGRKCFVQKVHGRVSEATTSAINHFLGFLVNSAVALGEKLLETGLDHLANKIDKI